MNRTIFSRRLQRALRDLTFKYFGDEDETSWQAGGCWLLAEALRILLGGKLWAFVYERRGRPSIEHVVVRTSEGLYADAHGLQTKRELLRQFAADTDGRSVSYPLVRFSEKDQQRIMEEGGIGRIYCDTQMPFDAPQLAEELATRISASR